MLEVSGDGRATILLMSEIRKRPEFVAMDRPEDENVFMRKKFRYGVDDRKNVGFGLWQLAYGSKQTLDATNYAAARVATVTGAGAILVCALMLASIASHGDSPITWQPDGARSLSSTVQVALFQPSFSNRSIGSVVGNGFLALLVLGGSVYFSRRRRINPVQRTGPHGPSTDLDR